MLDVRKNVFIVFGKFQDFPRNKKSEILWKFYVMWNSVFIEQFLKKRIRII